MTQVACSHWSPIERRGVVAMGRCAIGLHGGMPSVGTCMIACKRYEGPAEARVEFRVSASRKHARRADAEDDRPLAELVVSYVAAEWSLLRRGPVAQEIREERLSACRRCPHRREHRDDAVGSCARCGCAGEGRALLGVRTWMPAATCPASPPRWGEAEGTGRAGLARLGGTTTQVIGIVRNVAAQVRARRRRRIERRRAKEHGHA